MVGGFLSGILPAIIKPQNLKKIKNMGKPLGLWKRVCIFASSNINNNN